MFRFLVFFFGPKTSGILTLWPGMEPAPPALEGEVLISGSPGKFLNVFFFFFFFKQKINERTYHNAPHPYILMMCVCESIYCTIYIFKAYSVMFLVHS